MDIYEALRQDHEKVRDILDKIDEESQSAIKSRERDFTRLCKELVPHEKAEEAVFYPKLMDEDHREDALEAVEEHHAVDVMLKELKGLSFDDERWKARMSVIKEMIEHHIEEEEGQIFEDANDVFSEDEAEQVAQEFESKKREIASSL